jgi:hypothetical protein
VVVDGREWRARRPEETGLHLAVRDGFASVVAEAEERAGLPRRIRTIDGWQRRCWGIRVACLRVCELGHATAAVARERALPAGFANAGLSCAWTDTFR